MAFDPVAEPAKATAFRNVYSIGNTPILTGLFGGKLDNSGETVELMKPENPAAPLTTGFVLVDRVNYDNVAPWPASVTCNEAPEVTTRQARNRAVDLDELVAPKTRIRVPVHPQRRSNDLWSGIPDAGDEKAIREERVVAEAFSTQWAPW